MQTQMMQLKRLEISKQSSYSSDNPGRYQAEIQFEGTYGSIKVPLTPEISERLLAIVGPLIAELGSRAANEIAGQVLQSVEEAKAKLIELPNTQTA